MEPVKISFGFSKRSTKPNIISNNAKQEKKKLELIECLEGQSIKVKDAVEVVKQPLIIPLKDNQKNLLDRIRSAKKQDKQDKDELVDPRPDSELSADELAARELTKEAKSRLATGYSNNTKVSVLPLNDTALSLEGEVEPTLQDYESVPINDYGFAMLRGMGWKEGMAIGKNSSKSAAVSVPELRPKGLGLGATKVVTSEMPAKKPVDKDGNELILVNGCSAKVIAGPQKGNYCKVQGFDEDAGRVIIKVYPKCELVNINESLLLPVTTEEFLKGSKIINNAKYEEYKEISDKKLDNYKIKAESANSKPVKEEIENVISDSEDDADSNKKERQRKYEKNKHKSESANKDYEREKLKQTSSRYCDGSKSPSAELKRSDNEHYRKNKERRRSRSTSGDKIRSHVSKYKSKRENSTSSSSSDDEVYYKGERKRCNEKDESKHHSRSRSHSKHTNNKVEQFSSGEEHYEKDKKHKKHTKSKKRDKTRSHSRDKPKVSKKHGKHDGDTSEEDDDTDYKKEKRKKNKCKSRHRRNSSSSGEDRRCRNKR